MCDEPDGNIWQEYIMNGGKLTTHDDSLIFNINGESYILKDDHSKKILDCKSLETHSQDAINIISFSRKKGF